MTQPGRKRVEHLKLSDELAKLNLPNPLKDPIGTDIGCEDNKLVLTLQGEGESPNTPRASIPSRAGIAVVFDVEKPHSPRIKRVLDPLRWCSRCRRLGLYRHQVFVAGDELIEYQDFQARTDGRLRGFGSKMLPHRVAVGEIPGDVVEMKFVMGPRKDWEAGKTADIAKQYRRANPQERRELETLAPLDQGVLFIATEHAVVSMDTSLKWLIWRLGDNRTASDHFSRLYGIDVYRHSAVYVAAGTEGVYLLHFNPVMVIIEFKKCEIISNHYRLPPWTLRFRGTGSMYCAVN